MDSWNNNEGRKIADEIKKEYGKNFDKLSDKEKDAVIATKVMMKMRNGELITHPSDERQFKGLLETLFYRLTDKPTGGAAPVSKLPHEMYYTGYVNQETGDGKLFSRELISQMRGDEYTSSEPAIMAQLRSIGIPYESDLELASISGGGVVYVKPYTRSDGTEVRGYYRSVY